MVAKMLLTKVLVTGFVFFVGRWSVLFVSTPWSFLAKRGGNPRIPFVIVDFF